MSTHIDEARLVGRRAGLRRDLVRGSLWTLTAAMITMPLSFVANLVVVRALGPAEFARYAVFCAALAITMTVANAGFTAATSQELAVAHAHGDDERTVELIRRCAGFFALVETPVLVVVTLVVLHGAPPAVIAGAVVACVIAFVLSTALVALSGSARNAAAARATLATTVVGQAGVCVVAAVTERADLCWAARLASLAIAPLVAFCYLSPQHRRAILRPALPVGLGRTFRSTATAFWALSVTALLLLDRTEIFVLRWNEDITAVAVFALATTVTAQLTVPMDSLMGPLAPTSAALVASDSASGARILRSSLRVSSLCGAFTAAIALPALVAAVPTIFGATYGGHGAALFALGIISCLDSSATPVRALAFATRSAGGILRLTLVGLVLDVAIALTLIPVLGLTGAVLALAAGQTVFVVLLVRLVARRLGVDARAVFAATRLSVFGAAIGVVAFVLTAAAGSPIAHAVGAAVLGALLLCGVLRLGGLHLRLEASDLHRVMAVLPRRVGRGVARGARLLSLVEARTAE